MLEELNGRKINVEMGGQIKRANVTRDPHVKEGTIKLHVSGIRRNGDERQFREKWEEHTTVHQCTLMPGKG